MDENRRLLQVTVAVCAGPRNVSECHLQLPEGATVADALTACGASLPSMHERSAAAAGLWGRVVDQDCPLAHGDRVEIYRTLKVDPKVARRERFTSQGARTAGLFARKRPGGKPGY